MRRSETRTIGSVCIVHCSGRLEIHIVCRILIHHGLKLNPTKEGRPSKLCQLIQSVIYKQKKAQSLSIVPSILSIVGARVFFRLIYRMYAVRFSWFVARDSNTEIDYRIPHYLDKQLLLHIGAFSISGIDCGIVFLEVLPVDSLSFFNFET